MRQSSLSARRESPWEYCDLTIALIDGTEVPAGAIVQSFKSGNTESTVIERVNRFTVRTAQDGIERICHLHDPGRLRELIYSGNEVLTRRTAGKKTGCSITCAKKGDSWILTDSRFHNPIARKFLGSKARAEVVHGNSRIDFLTDGCFVEVKGCSLEQEGIAMFPDAPSARALKHVRELEGIVKKGGQAMIMILVFSPGARTFEPNYSTDPEFSSAFCEALSSGVQCIVLKFSTDRECIRYLGTIPVSPCKHHV